jgi:hypothetical protein
VASDGCTGVDAGDRIALWLSQQNSQSLLSTGVLKGRRRVGAGAGVGGGFGGEDGGMSSSTTVALPSREVVSRMLDDEGRRRRGGGRVLPEVRLGLDVGGGSTGSSDDAMEPFNTSCKRR